DAAAAAATTATATVNRLASPGGIAPARRRDVTGPVGAPDRPQVTARAGRHRACPATTRRRRSVRPRASNRPPPSLPGAARRTAAGQWPPPAPRGAPAAPRAPSPRG